MDRSVYYNLEGYGSFSEQSVNTPGFHKLKYTGVPLPENDYLWRRYDTSDPVVMTHSGLRRQRDVAGLGRSVETCFRTELFTVPASPFSTRRSIKGFPTISSVVQNRVLAKVRNSRVDLGVALGEYAETAQTVSDCIRQTAGLLRDFRKNPGRAARSAVNVFTGGRPQKLSDVLRRSSDTWLFLNYGVLPLIRDAWDVSEAFQNRYEPYPIVKSVRSFERAFASELLRDSFPNLYGQQIREAQITAQASAKCEVTFQVTNPLLKTLDECGAINPVSVAWELIPLSFVVDWFIPVGTFLTNVVPPQGVDFVSGYLYEKSYGIVRYKVDDPPLPIPNGQYGWKTESSSIETYKSRKRLTSFPRYQVIVPDLSLSKEKIISALALLTQALL